MPTAVVRVPVDALKARVEERIHNLEECTRLMEQHEATQDSIGRKFGGVRVGDTCWPKIEVNKKTVRRYQAMLELLNLSTEPTIELDTDAVLKVLLGE